jgi:hypothetical protein
MNVVQDRPISISRLHHDRLVSSTKRYPHSRWRVLIRRL